MTRIQLRNPGDVDLTNLNTSWGLDCDVKMTGNLESLAVGIWKRERCVPQHTIFGSYKWFYALDIDLTFPDAMDENQYERLFDGKNIRSLTWRKGTFSVPAMNNWMLNVQNNGTFYYTDRNLNVLDIPRNASGIPASWTIQYIGQKPSLVFSINGRAVSSLTINGKAVAKLG